MILGTSSYEKKLFKKVLQIVNEYDCSLGTRILLLIIYDEIDSKIFDTDFIKKSMQKHTISEMLVTITIDADFFDNTNKPLVELIVGMKIDETNQVEVEEEVINKAVKFIRKMRNVIPKEGPTFEQQMSVNRFKRASKYTYVYYLSFKFIW